MPARRFSEAHADHLDVAFRCRATVLRLLLENVQDVDGLPKPHGVDGAVGAAGVVVHDLQHARSSKTREHLRRFVTFAPLREVDREAHLLPYPSGHCPQVPPAAPQPPDGFQYPRLDHRLRYYPGCGISSKSSGSETARSGLPTTPSARAEATTPRGSADSRANSWGV